VRPDKGSATLGDQPDAINNRGIIYTTRAQSKNFKFKSWGQHKVIGFLSEMYFAAYDKKVTQAMNDTGETVAYLFDKSENGNLMTNEQLTKVLIDSDTETTFTSDNPLELREGYVLAIKSIDFKGDKVYLELSKNGQVADDKVVQPSKDRATMTDKTYYYNKTIGRGDEIVTIAVHFKDAFRGSGDNSAIVDGIFQISDTPIYIESNQQYGKMSIKKVDSMKLSILMDNKNYNITLSKNKNILLMEDIYSKNSNEDTTAIYIKTSDQESINSTNPLRYYIYKKEVIEE
jgi:S-layer protein (TIGR01567 family)